MKKQTPQPHQPRAHFPNSAATCVDEYIGNDKLLIGIVLGILTFWLFAQSLVNVTPAIQSSIAISHTSLNLAVSLSALFAGCFIVVGGGLADTLGRVRFAYIGFLLSIAGSFLLVIANGPLLFTFGRIVQGISAACLMPASLALIKTYYADEQRQRALSFWSIGSWGGSGLCSLVGGAIATFLGWRWIFIISIIFAIVGMFFIKGTPESKVPADKNTKFDYQGLIYFVAALFSLNMVISEGERFGWLSGLTLSLIAIFAVSSVLFVRHSLQLKSHALINFALFKNHAYRGAVFSNFMLNAVAGTLIVANTYIQVARGFSAFETGLLSIGYLIAVLVMIRIGEKTLQSVGAKSPMLWGTLIAGIGIACMSFTFLSNMPYFVLVSIGFVLFGLGLGFYATPSTDTALMNVPFDKVGVASGIYKMASSLGGAFGVAISAAVYTGFSDHNIHAAATMGLMVNIVFCILALIAIMLLIPKEKIDLNE